ncbi:hypothetical protein [Prevotella dentasini]|uniref:hypothetical protein n=1 Tax=Prevotella dentasini TaxID=589537 RepID=UPI00046A7D7E|nr:hypothetical protein [Prevotella dentasini]
MIYTGNQKIDWGKHSLNDDFNNANSEYFIPDLQLYDNFVYTNKCSGSFFSNIMTSIAVESDGFILAENGKPLTRGTFSIDKLYNRRITYKENIEDCDGNEGNFGTLRKVDDRGNFVCAQINTTSSSLESYDGTVENFQCSILVHEWYNHGVLGITGKNHNQIYNNIKKNDLFKYTTPRYKFYIDYMIQKTAQDN